MEAQDTQNTTPVATESQQQQPATVPESTAQAQAAVQTPSCTGNCKNCTEYQRNYCAAQIGFNMQNALAALATSVKELRDVVANLYYMVQDLGKKSEEQPAIIEAPTPDDQPKKKKPASK